MSFPLNQALKEHLVTLYLPVIVVLTNREDSISLLLEAERQGLMNGDYVFFLVQHFEVSEAKRSKINQQIRMCIFK